MITSPIHLVDFVLQLSTFRKGGRQPSLVLQRTVQVRLPNELLISVAGHLRNSKGEDKSLLRFSLVCRTWRDLARPFVFHSITLRSSDAENELANLIKAEPGISLWIRSLAYLSPSPLGFSPRSWMDHFQVGDEFPLSGLIPKLEELILRGSFLNMEDGCSQKYACEFPTVKKLTLCSLIVTTGNFAAGVSAFRNLESLTCKEVSIYRPVDAQPHSHTLPPRLTTLAIPSPIDDIRQLVGFLPPFRTINNLTLSWHHIGENQATQTYIRMLEEGAMELKCFTMQFVGYEIHQDSTVEICVACKPLSCPVSSFLDMILIHIRS